MKLQRELRKQLASEFSRIRPDILKVVAGIVTEGMDRKSPDQIFFDIFDEDTINFPDVEQRNSMIYETLLTCAREICADSNKINEIKGVIQRAVAKVGISKPNTTTSAPKEQNEPKCTIFFSKTSHIDANKKNELMSEEKVGRKRKNCLTKIY
jgi:hypothetical protein